VSYAWGNNAVNGLEGREIAAKTQNLTERQKGHESGNEGMSIEE
jgi:hypothetical protein